MSYFIIICNRASDFCHISKFGFGLRVQRRTEQPVRAIPKAMGATRDLSDMFHPIKLPFTEAWLIAQKASHACNGCHSYMIFEATTIWLNSIWALKSPPVPNVHSAKWDIAFELYFILNYIWLLLKTTCARYILDWFRDRFIHGWLQTLTNSNLPSQPHLIQYSSSRISLRWDWNWYSSSHLPSRSW